MYRISPNKGRSWECNGNHILSLRKSKNPGRGELCTVTVAEYITWSNNKKSEWKLWRKGVDSFAHREKPPVDPYFIGMLLGDGDRPHDVIGITTKDIEIITTLFHTAASWRLNLVQRDEIRWHLTKKSGKINPLLQAVKSLGLNVSCEDKFVPDWYKYGDKSCRLQVLAGLLDTDGSYMAHANCYDFISKSKQLANDTAFLARSLGMAAYVKSCIKSCGDFSGVYYRVTISGDVDEIPCQIERKKARAREQDKDVTNTGFAVQQIADGPWAGFEVDQDNLYLLDDFTVMHNTQAMLPAEKILKLQETLNIAPKSMTKAAVIDQLRDARNVTTVNGGSELIEYHALQIFVSEL
ncbi:MAG: LAGLIDADG family homing endonuclease, partial [Sulfurovaceae bacterium]|nr:LAGLIDADG family homing endonuclease [Sulfurovaceae bacterium]